MKRSLTIKAETDRKLAAEAKSISLSAIKACLEMSRDTSESGLSCNAIWLVRTESDNRERNKTMAGQYNEIHLVRRKTANNISADLIFGHNEMNRVRTDGHYRIKGKLLLRRRKRNAMNGVQTCLSSVGRK